MRPRMELSHKLLFNKDHESCKRNEQNNWQREIVEKERTLGPFVTTQLKDSPTGTENLKSHKSHGRRIGFISSGIANPLDNSNLLMFQRGRVYAGLCLDDSRETLYAQLCPDPVSVTDRNSTLIRVRLTPCEAMHRISQGKYVNHTNNIWITPESHIHINSPRWFQRL